MNQWAERIEPGPRRARPAFGQYGKAHR
jgi:hypothetical protein